MAPAGDIVNVIGIELERAHDPADRAVGRDAVDVERVDHRLQDRPGRRIGIQLLGAHPLDVVDGLEGLVALGDQGGDHDLELLLTGQGGERLGIRSPCNGVHVRNPQVWLHCGTREANQRGSLCSILDTTPHIEKGNEHISWYTAGMARGTHGVRKRKKSHSKKTKKRLLAKHAMLAAKKKRR